MDYRILTEMLCESFSVLEIPNRNCLRIKFGSVFVCNGTFEYLCNSRRISGVPRTCKTVAAKSCQERCRNLDSLAPFETWQVFTMHAHAEPGKCHNSYTEITATPCYPGIFTSHALKTWEVHHSYFWNRCKSLDSLTPEITSKPGTCKKWDCVTIDALSLLAAHQILHHSLTSSTRVLQTQHN